MGIHWLVVLVALSSLSLFAAPLARASVPASPPPVSFASTVSYGLPISGVDVTSLALGALRGGTLDDIVSGDSNGDITVFLNKGDGTFAPGVEYSTGGTSITAVAVADLNGDGYPDVIAAVGGGYNGANNGIYIFLNDGVGGFEAPFTVPNYDNGSGDTPTSLAVGDFLGNGYQDLVDGTNAPGAGPSTIHVFSNDGTGHFTLVSTFTTGNTYSSVTAVQTANFNSSLLPGVLVTVGGGNGSCYGLEPFINDGTGHLSDPGNIASSVCDSGALHGAGLADFNRDGNLDIAAPLPSASTDETEVYLGAGSGTFPTHTDVPLTLGRPADTVAADFNGDGSPDFVTSCDGFPCTSAQQQIYLGNGDGTFTNGPAIQGGIVMAVGQLTPSCDSSIVSSGYQINLSANIDVALNTTPSCSGPSPPAGCTLSSALGAIFGLSYELANYPLGPIPISVVASTRASELDLCETNESTNTYPYLPSFSVDATPGENGAATTSFSFSFTASTPWSRAISQQRTSFSVGNFATLQVDWSHVAATVDQNGDIEFPLAKAESKPADATLIDDGGSHYLSAQTELEGDLAATLNVQGLSDYLRWVEGINPQFAPVIVASTVANEIVGGMAKAARHFRGLRIPANVLADYGVNLANSQLGVSAPQGSNGSSKIVGQAVGTVVFAGVGFAVLRAALGFAVCGPPCAVAGATARAHIASRSRSQPPAIKVAPTRLKGSRLDLARIAHLYVARCAPQIAVAATRQLFETPAAFRVGPIITSRRHIRAGRKVAIVVDHLANKKHHRILLTIAGPAFAGRLLLTANHGVAGALVRLPSRMRAGRWFIATEDLSMLRPRRAAAGSLLAGRADDRVSVFAVSPRKRQKKH